MAKILLNELEKGNEITGVFAVNRFEVRDYQNGRYMRMRLADASGKMNAVMWNGVVDVEKWLTEGSLAKVTGRVGLYRNAPQITVSQVEPVTAEDELDMADFMPVTPYSRPDMAARLIEIVHAVQDPAYRGLMQAFIADGVLLNQFCQRPAAKRWHHAHVGGLLEHTLTVLELCRRIAPFYREADPSLLLCGALFHDAGKIEELDSGYTVEYTDEGRLLGHILLGELIVHRLAETLSPAMPKRKIDLVRHLVLSHHGQEAHSPQKPQSLEANILHYVENMDAQMNAMTREVLQAREQGQSWSPYIPLLDRYLYAGEH